MKKRLVCMLLALVIVVGMVPQFAAPVQATAGNSTAWYEEHCGQVIANISSATYYGANNGPRNFSKGQCTWYCWGRAYEKTGQYLTFETGSANGGDWYERVSDSFRRGWELKSNSIACYNGNVYGHVIYIEWVDGDDVYYTECNMDGNGIYDGDDCKLKKSTQSKIRARLNSSYQGCIYLDTTSTAHAVDTSYGTNFTAYPKAQINAENIFDAYHNQISSTAWIGTSDQCTIHEVYTDGCCKVSYPLDGGGTKTVYSKISLFSWAALQKPIVSGSAQFVQRSTPVTISWNAVSGASAYVVDIWRDNKQVQWIDVGNATSYTYNYPDGVMDVFVRAYNSAGSATSEAVRVVGCVTDLCDNANEFYAYLIQETEWYHLDIDEDNNVKLITNSNDTTDPKQIWKAVKSDGYSYVFYNQYNGKALTASGPESGANVKVADYIGSDLQRWYVVWKTGGGAYLVPKANANVVLDVYSSVEKGQNVELYEHNVGENQCFAVYPLANDGVTYVKPERPPVSDLQVSVDNKTQKASFTWTSSPLQSDRYDARVYDLRIWKGTDTSASSIYFETIEGLSKSGITLEPGTYTAIINAVNQKYYKWYIWGEPVTFKVCKYDYTVAQKPTTSATGRLTGTCTDCGATVSVTLPKLGTTNYSYSVNKAATCTASGTGRYTWKTTTYGSFYFDVTIAATGHTYTSKVTAPTCTAQGYTTYTCACGHSYKDAYTNATGHSYSYKVTKAPTTSAKGTLTGTCSKCSGTTAVTLPKLTTTDYSYAVTKAATCTTTGIGRYTWKTTTYGSFYFDVTIAATGHTYTSKVTAPTCTAQGYTTHTCACGYSYKDTYTNAVGHSYNYKVTKAPTTSAKGTLTGTCSKCSGTTAVTLPKLTTTDYSYAVKTAATCTASGTGRYTWKTTTYGSFYFDVAIAATGHSYTSKVTAPTCTEQGYTTHTCSCGNSYKDAYTNALGHSYSEGKCTICNATDPSYAIDPNAPQIIAESKTAAAGDTVTVTVSLKNNPGITNVQVLVEYDAAKFELVSVAEKDYAGVSFGPITANPIAVSWSDTLNPNNTNNGVLAELTFRVKEDAAIGDSEIKLSYDPDNIYNASWDNVSFETVNGVIEVVDYIPGDVNRDGKVNFKDSGIMLQFLNGWSVSIDQLAADINHDGKLNMKDYGLFIQYLNGWPVTIQ